MTLTLCTWVMGFAYYLTEVIIWLKINENPSRSKGEMGRTQKSRINPMTFISDLESAYGFSTLSTWDEHLTKADHLTEMNIWPKYNENPAKGKGYGVDTKFKGKSFKRFRYGVNKKVLWMPSQLHSGGLLSRSRKQCGAWEYRISSNKVRFFITENENQSF